MSNKRLRIFAAVSCALIAINLAAAFFWFRLSPYLALAGLRETAIQRDAKELEQRIVYSSLREDMMKQVPAWLTSKDRKDVDGHSLAALDTTEAIKMTVPMVDTLMSPGGLSYILERGYQPLPGTSIELFGEFAVHWQGFNRFYAYSARARTLNLVFDRDGLSWRLSGIHVPLGLIAGVMPKPASADIQGEASKTGPTVYTPTWETRWHAK